MKTDFYIYKDYLKRRKGDFMSRKIKRNAD